MSDKHTKVKILASSLLLAAAWDASAAIGGLQIQSKLNEPFAATVSVTGDEARALGSGAARPTVAGADLTATVVQQGADRAVVRLQSSGPVKEPVLTFWLGVGNQNRQYTAMLDPRGYQAAQPAAAQERRAARQNTAEQRVRVRRNDGERQQNVSRASASRARVEVVTGTAYQVKDGELLVNIAERVRPEGMTLRQTINALVRANPRAFRNGNPDLMYRDSVLIIPDAAQLRRLANNPHIRVRPQAVQPTEAAAARQPETKTAETVSAPVAAAETVQENAAAAESPASVAAPAESAQTVAVQAVSEAAAASAESGVAAAEGETVAAASQADMPLAASETAAASEPPVSENPVEVAAPPVVAAETAAAESEESASDGLMSYAAYGGAALLAGGLAYAFLRRRRADGETADEEQSAAAGGQADDGDGVFLEDDAAGAVPADTASTNAVLTEQDLSNIDLGRLSEQQHLGNTPETPDAPETQDNEWGWVEGSGHADTDDAATVAQSAVSLAAEKNNDEWVEFDDVLSGLPAADSVETEKVSDEISISLPAAAADEGVGQSLDDDWLTELDNIDWSAGAADQNAESPAVSAETDDLVARWDLGAAEQEDVAQTADATAASSVFDSTETLGFESLNFLDESGESPLAAQEAAAQPAETNPFQADTSLSAEDLTFAAQDEVSAPVSALPQEALEAKLELAKMYLEIDDANTARSTLMELIHESEGSSIQAQARSLLNELG